MSPPHTFSNIVHYGNCLKVLSAVRKKKFVIRTGIQKMLVRIANREDPDQTASSGLMLKTSVLNLGTFTVELKGQVKCQVNIRSSSSGTYHI